MFDVELYGPAYSPDERCGVRKMPARLSSTEFVGERAVNYLRNVRNPQQPFFLAVSFPDPHHPFTSCAEDYEEWKDRPVGVPVGTPDDLKTRPAHYALQHDGGWTRRGEVPLRHPGGVPKEIAEERIRHTYAMIERIDKNVGKVLDELERAGLAEDTIVIFASDHGELLGDHGLWLKGPFFYEGLINTPLLMRIPGFAPRRSEQLVSTIDLAPTIYDLLGIEIPAFTDGLSQVPGLHDETISVRDSCTIEYRNGYDCDKNVNVLVTPAYKFVQYETGEMEYTDLINDPEEQTNHAGEAGWEVKTWQAAQKLLIEKLKNKSKGAIQYGHA